MSVWLGITGGIGSGKSTVCKIFELLGAPVFQADIVAKQLINTSEEIKNGLIRLFGDGIYTPNNGIDRKKLAAIIFNDDIQLEKVNKLVHPLVRDEFNTWAQKQNAPYLVHEAAILFESGFYKMMDFTILVTAPEKLRVQWVSNRDGVSSRQVKERINKQWPDDKKRELATLELRNDNTRLLIPQIIKIDKQLKEHGKIW